MQPKKIEDVMEKLRTLPPERLEEVADFVGFMKQRTQAHKKASTLKSQHIKKPEMNRWTSR